MLQQRKFPRRIKAKVGKSSPFWIILLLNRRILLHHGKSSNPLAACPYSRSCRVKSLWSRDVPETGEFVPTFQGAFFESTFASSNPPTPATQCGLCGVISPGRARLAGLALHALIFSLPQSPYMP